LDFPVFESGIPLSGLCPENDERSLMNKVFSIGLAFTLSLHLLLSFPWGAYATERVSDRLPQCEGITESSLRVELNRMIQDYLANESGFDVRALVDRQWRTLKLDATFDGEVDRAIAAVTADTGLVNRFKSSWLPAQANALANQVTEQTFQSEGLNRKLDQLSQNVADELADQLELISAKSSSYAMDCLQRFISRQYSQSFVEIFGNKIQDARADTVEIPDAFDANTRQFLKTHSFAFGGAAVFAVAGVTRQVIGKKIISRITQQVVERIAGRLGTTAIPFVGEIIGGVMLTSDVISSFDGALPEIQKSLKEPEVKATFQEKITYQIDDELRNESYQIAREISNEIYAEWLDFQKDYRDTLNLAAALPEFQALLTKTPNVSQISALVGIALNNMGRSQLIEAIQSGDFERALSLPEGTYSILENSHDLHTLIDWANLAGNQVDEVVRLELYKHLSPSAIDRKLLREILAIKDDSLIAKLSLLDIQDIRNLFAIATPNLITLSAHLSPDDLRRLSHYLMSLESSEINDFIRFLMDDPTQFKSIGIEYLIQSHDIKAAIQFWNSPSHPKTILSGVLKIVTQQIHWQLFVAKFGILILGLVTLLPMMLFLITGVVVLRLVRARKGKILAETTEEQKLT
jgi:hypothetical protein